MDTQIQIDELKSRLDLMTKSASIPRDVETALRVRLGIGATSQAFPVNSIFIEIAGTNPATTLGYGTWVAFGTGQVLVGYKSGDSDFGTVLATGGEKTHVLTTTEMPSHTHTVPTGGAGGATASLQPTTVTSATVTSSSTGGDGAHNNLQPFIVVYFWKRTA